MASQYPPAAAEHLSYAGTLVLKSARNLVPGTLQVLPDEIGEVVTTAYGSWDLINWHGSAPRGSFIAGESDVDFAAVIPNEIRPESHQLRRELLGELEMKWRAFGVTKIDLSVIPAQNIEDPG